MSGNRPISQTSIFSWSWAQLSSNFVVWFNNTKLVKQCIGNEEVGGSGFWGPPPGIPLFWNTMVCHQRWFISAAFLYSKAYSKSLSTLKWWSFSIAQRSGTHLQKCACIQTPPLPTSKRLQRSLESSCANLKPRCAVRDSWTATRSRST